MGDAVQAISDQAAIGDVVEDYVVGAALGQIDRLARALHPRFQTAGQYRGAETWLDRDAALAMARSAEGRTAANLRWSVMSLDVVGNTAVARVVSGEPGAEFDELLSFLRDGGRWRIVFKTFHIAG